jgi:hypothetical protein
MRFSKASAITFCIFLFVSLATAFYGTGSIEKYEPPKPQVSAECSDGNDNDGDGYADGNDPGCTKPFNLDRAEEDVRDSDATYAFANGEPNVGDASPAFPGWYKDAQLAGWDGWNDQVSQSGTQATASEQYAKNEDGFWAGGDRFTHDVSFTDSTSKSYSIGSFVVSIPAPDDVTDRTCGNGDRESGEGDNMGCPQDWGLPDDLGRTESESSSSITSYLSYDSSVTSPETGNEPLLVDYTMDMEGYEHNTDHTDYIYGLSSDTTKVYPIDEINNDPDFYTRPGDRDGIWKVWLKDTQEVKIGEVTDHDKKYDDFDHYTDSGTDIDTSCDDVGFNETCDYSGDHCVSNNDRTIPEHLLDANSDTLTADTQRRYTSKTGTYDYTREKTREGFQVTVWHDDERMGSDINAYECTNNNVKEASCDTTGSPSAGTCHTEDSRDVYTNNQKTDVPYDYEENTKTYKYDKLVWDEEKIYDTNPGESPRDSKRGLFGQYTYLGYQIGTRHPQYSDIYPVSSGGRAYWTVDANMTYGGFSNHPAVSSSVFKVELDSNDFFVSKRDWYGLYDADGSYGGGDSYVPIKQGSVSGDAVNSIFGNETKIVSSDGTTVGTMEGQEANYVGPNDYGGASCPDGFGFCVAAIDLNNEPLSSWSNPSNPPQPGSGITFEQEGLAHVNESWSVCRLYQEQIGGADNSFLRCQFDHARNYPNGPTPSYRAGILPFNPANTNP